MTWFALPPVSSDSPPEFGDMNGCNAWLAAQPLANAPLMQETLGSQLFALNRFTVSSRERFKILETLRKPIFAIETESAKRYDGRPLPLASVERKALELSCRVWRELAIGYLHCLRACIDGDAALGEHRAKIAHRALTSLRLEQISCYRGGALVPQAWWTLLHATFVAAEQLGVAATAISDRLLADTRESTPAGQYAMTILLHLSRPYELTRSQFAAAQRWLARWREQVRIHPSASAAGDARCVIVDLGGTQPLAAGSVAPGTGRWLSLDTVLGKIKQRARDLRDGKTPEELHLGNLLPADACLTLLQFLHGALQAPPSMPPGSRNGATEIGVASTLDRIHHLLGGTPIQSQQEPTTLSNRKLHEQIAIFGHVVRDSGPSAEEQLERWQVLAEAPGKLRLRLATDVPCERLSCRSLIALKKAGDSPCLAILRSLATAEDGSLLATVQTLNGKAVAVTAIGREKVTGRSLPQPAAFLPAAGDGSVPASLFISAGTMSRLTRLDVVDIPGGLKPGQAFDRGANFERLRCE